MEGQIIRGHQALRLGADVTAPVVTSAGPRHAYCEGFDLHANVAVRAGERRRLEHLQPIDARELARIGFRQAARADREWARRQGDE